MTPGRKIKNVRLDRGFAQFELAEMVGLSCSGLSKIESDINYPRSGAAYRIARALCVTVEFIVDESMPYPLRAAREASGEGPGEEGPQ